MSHGKVLLLVVFSLTALVWLRWRFMTRARADEAFARKHGCLPIQAVLAGDLPFGVDSVKGFVVSNAEQRLLLFMQPHVERMGLTFELRMLGNASVITTDPENIKAVLSKSTIHEGEFDFVFGQRRHAFLPLLGEGIFTQDGLEWKHSREMMRKQFARIHGQNLDLVAEHVELLIQRLSTMKSMTVDLHPIFGNFTLDTTTALLFGESAGSLHEDDQDDFGKNLNMASWYSAIRIQLAYLYWLCCLPSFYKACKKVKEYADKWVMKALKDMDYESDAGQYEFIRNVHDELQDRQLVRDQLVNVLLAGRDTTAAMLSWTFRLLVRNQNVLSRLREEIDSVMLGRTIVTKGDLQNMPYLKSVLSESLRLYPPVPINTREAKKTTCLPRGGGPDGLSPIIVSKGQGVGYSPYFMHRRKDLFGEDALSFRPERWEDGKLQERVGWGYLPFNAGPRICLGQEFALLEASYAIIRILQAFPFLKLPADEIVEPIGAERQSITITLTPVDGCRVDLEGQACVGA